MVAGKAASAETEGDTCADTVRLQDTKSESSVGLITSASCSGFSVQHVRVDTSDGYNFAWQGAPHYVALHDMRARDGETFADTASARRIGDIRGRLTFIPAGCPAWGWQVPVPGTHSFTALYFHPEQMEGELAIRLAQMPQRAQLYFFQAPLRATLEKLQSAMRSDSQPDSMYLESLFMLAALELCHSQGQPRDDADGGRLSGKVAEQLTEFIEENLAADVQLADLASIAGLSRFHFARAFKRTLHETPYQHLLRRRIERAQQLLRDGSMSIQEISAAVGFKNATRFAAAFRRLAKCSPSVYRASTRR